MIKDIYLLVWKRTGNPVPGAYVFSTYEEARKARLHRIHKDHLEVVRFVADNDYNT